MLRTLPNPRQDRTYSVTLTGTLYCLCPVNGLADTATVEVTYWPAAELVEYTAFRDYLASFAKTAESHEAITNRVLDDLAERLAPRAITVRAEWKPVEGVPVVVEAGKARQRDLSNRWASA